MEKPQKFSLVTVSNTQAFHPTVEDAIAKAREVIAQRQHRPGFTTHPEAAIYVMGVVAVVTPEVPPPPPVKITRFDS